jgi:hypothetical protein
MKLRENVLKQTIKEILKIDVMTNSRKRDIVDARKIYSNILHNQGQGVTHISKTLHKDHSTIVHYIKEGSMLFLMDTTYKANYNNVLESFARKMEGGEIVGMTREELESEVSSLRIKLYDIKVKFLNHLRKANTDRWG